MRLPDHAGCEWIPWHLGGWYTITAQVITLPEYICCWPKWWAQVHMRGSLEYRVQGILGCISGVLVCLHKVL